MKSITYSETCKQIPYDRGLTGGGHQALRTTSRGPTLRTAIAPSIPNRGTRRRSVSGPTSPIYIQLLRDHVLYGVEKGELIRLLKKVKATDKDRAVRINACLILKEIRRGREIIDSVPLISETYSKKKSQPIFIHFNILREIQEALDARNLAALHDSFSRKEFAYCKRIRDSRLAW